MQLVELFEQVDLSLREWIAQRWVEELGWIPVRQLENGTILGVCSDCAVIIDEAALSARVRAPVCVQRIASKQWTALYSFLYASKPPALLQVAEPASPLDEGAPVHPPRVMRELIELAFERKASDIHLEPIGDGTLALRLRVDGKMTRARIFSASQASSLISYIELRCHLRTDAHHCPQEGRMSFEIGNQSVPLRVGCLPSVLGKAITLRALTPLKPCSDLASLGLFPEQEEEVLNHLLPESAGLMLVTGPTGSGKTTTLYTFLQYLASQGNKVVTLEDPIEGALEGVSQVPLSEERGLTFSHGLRSLLRQAPGVILIGEIRDEQSARAAITSALTGHVVLSSVHSDDAISAFTRLTELGIAPKTLRSALKLILAQRLVRRLCEHCKEPLDESSFRRFPCPGSCENGFLGRLGVFELLQTRWLGGEALATGDREQLLTQARLSGFATMKASGDRLVNRGITTPAELYSQGII